VGQVSGRRQSPTAHRGMAKAKQQQDCGDNDNRSAPRGRMTDLVHRYQDHCSAGRGRAPQKIRLSIGRTSREIETGIQQHDRRRRDGDRRSHRECDHGHPGVGERTSGSTAGNSTSVAIDSATVMDENNTVRPAGGHRAGQRHLASVALRQLISEATENQQRVVDGQCHAPSRRSDSARKPIHW